MRKILKINNKPNKSQAIKPDPITVSINPLDKVHGIVIPEIQYTVTAEVDMKTKFIGKITPMPTVLMHILTHLELKIIAIIMEETCREGKCVLLLKDFVKYLNHTQPAISTAMGALRKRGLLIESRNGKNATKKIRALNFEAVQHLNDLVEGEDPGIYARIARATRKIDILHLTKEDIRNAYDNKVLPPDHDPAEEEEYD